MTKTIGNPLSWATAAIGRGAHWADEATEHIGAHAIRPPQVQRLDRHDVARVLSQGFDDFKTMRSDVPFALAIYAVVALLFTGIASGATPLHLVFPMLAGFALIGPVAGIGLYEMSKRREVNGKAGLGDALGALRAETLGPILALAAYLFVVFSIWLYLAGMIHAATLGTAEPVGLAAFLSATFTTSAGWAMIALGTAVGFVFAVAVLLTSLVSFQMLLDRPVGLPLAVTTSFRVAARNSGVVALWGVTVAGLLLLGAIPAFLGLIVVIPVLAHASWHLYRAAVHYD